MRAGLDFQGCSLGGQRAMCADLGLNGNRGVLLFRLSQWVGYLYIAAGFCLQCHGGCTFQLEVCLVVALRKTQAADLQVVMRARVFIAAAQVLHHGLRWALPSDVIDLER